MENYIYGEIALLDGDSQLAIQLFKRSIRTYPDSPTVHTSLAETYLYEGNVSAALKSFQRAYELDSNVAAGLELYNMFILDEQKEKATLLLNDLSVGFPQNQELLYEKVKLSMEQGNWPNLIDTYAQLYLLDRTDKILDRIVEIGRATDNFDTVYSSLKNLKIQSKDSLKVIEILAQISYAQNEFENAVTHLNVLQKTPEKQMLANLLLGDIYLQKKDFKQSLENLQIVYDADNITFELLRTMLICYSNLNDEENELKIADEMVNKFPENPTGYEALALAYLFNARFVDALEVLDRAKSSFPENYIMYYYSGMALKQLQDLNRSLDNFTKALSLNSESNLIRRAIAMIHEEQGEYSCSDSLFTVILATDSENSTEMNDYAYLISERDGITMEKLDYALKMAQKALQIEPENPMVLDTVGWIYYRQENYEKALEYIQTSIDNGGENAVILEHLGDVYLQLKKLEKALESFQNALEKDPENKQLISKIKILNNE